MRSASILQVLQHQPQHFDAIHLLGVIAIQTRRTVRGIELITKAIGLNPNIAAAHANLGNALRELKRPEDALDELRQSDCAEAGLAETYYNRGLALQDLKRPEDALASYEKAIALKPNFADAYNNRGKAMRDLKRLDDVVASYDKVIALSPDYAEAHNNRGIALRDLKRPEDALANQRYGDRAEAGLCGGALQPRPCTAGLETHRGCDRELRQGNRPEAGLRRCVCEPELLLLADGAL